MDELDDVLDELAVLVLLLDEELESVDVVDELESVLEVLIECVELESVLALLSVLLDSELLLLLELDRDDKLLGDSELVDSDDRLLRDDDVTDWLLLDVVTLRDDSDPVEKLLDKLDDERLCELLLDELLELVDTVDFELGLLLDWLLRELAENDDVLDELTELDETLLVLLLDRLERLVLEELALLVLDELADEVLDELALDVLLLDRLDTLLVDRLDVLLDDTLEELRLLALDSLSSSTATIRRSCAISEPCCWPLFTMSNSASLVGKSRMAGVSATPATLSVRTARQSMSSSRVTVTNSVVTAGAWVVRWSVKLPLPSVAKICNCRALRWAPPFPK